MLGVHRGFGRRRTLSSGGGDGHTGRGEVDEAGKPCSRLERVASSDQRSEDSLQLSWGSTPGQRHCSLVVITHCVPCPREWFPHKPRKMELWGSFTRFTPCSALSVTPQSTPRHHPHCSVANLLGFLLLPSPVPVPLPWLAVLVGSPGVLCH